jgi:hypothetical protein
VSLKENIGVYLKCEKSHSKMADAELSHNKIGFRDIGMRLRKAGDEFYLVKKQNRQKNIQRKNKSHQSICCQLRWLAFHLYNECFL